MGYLPPCRLHCCWTTCLMVWTTSVFACVRPTSPSGWALSSRMSLSQASGDFPLVPAGWASLHLALPHQRICTRTWVPFCGRAGVRHYTWWKNVLTPHRATQMVGFQSERPSCRFHGLGKSLPLSNPQSLHLKVGIMMTYTSVSHCQSKGSHL